MTVTSTVRKHIYYGNGSATSWPIQFLFYSDEHITVKVKPIAAAEWTDVSSSNYSISGAGAPSGGALIYPLFDSPLASTMMLSVERLVPFTQTGVDLNNSSGFSPEIIEVEQDLAVMRDQQLRDGDGGAGFGFSTEASARLTALQLEDLATAVVLMPGATAFGYGTTIIRRSADDGLTYTLPENNVAQSNKPDLVLSIEQLKQTFPNVDRILLVISYFGNDLRADQCKVIPKREGPGRLTSPRVWVSGGVAYADAQTVTQVGGKPIYGSSPDDTSIVECITYLKAQGYKVVVYPFVLMDILPGNGLTDPYGGSEQAPLPWRGRITVMPADVGTSAARTKINTFFEQIDGYEDFIAHLAGLCDDAGGVYGFCVGTEFPGLTQVIDEAGNFPAVDKFTALIGTVKALNVATFVGYAADWTEYKNVFIGGNLYYNMDKLWAASDFIGVDNYMPLGDWRDNTFHKDYLDGWISENDEKYIESQIEGGELFTYFYANDAARLAQTRSAITDGAYSTPEEFQQKALRWFWGNFHYNRIAGVRSASPTVWVPKSKPIWITEFGVPSVNKGANQPNKFYTHAGSSESSFPYFSTGTEDFYHQRVALTTYLRYWRLNNESNAGQLMLPPENIFLWNWDARPHPAFPSRRDVWVDGLDWRYGHWLTGKYGASLRVGLEQRAKQDTILNDRRYFVEDVFPRGTSTDTAQKIPAKSIVLGAKIEVLEGIVGPTTLSLGDAGDGGGVSSSAGRYGTGISPLAGSKSYNPVTLFPIYGDMSLRITCVGGNGTAGRVRVHAYYLAPPA